MSTAPKLIKFNSNSPQSRGDITLNANRCMMRLVLIICGLFTVLWFCSEISSASPYRVRQNKDKSWFDGPPTEMPVLSVSEGATNIAAGKTVTSSAPDPIIGELHQLTDGDKGSVFDDEGCYVELMDGKQWVQVDLGTNAVIDAIWIWYRNPIEAYDVPNDVIVQISSNSNSTRNLSTVFNTDSDNSLGFGSGQHRRFASSRFGKLIPVNGLNGRYVRIWGNGGARRTMNVFVEIEVYGLPVADLVTTKGEGKTSAHQFTSPRRYLPVTLLVLGVGAFWWLLQRLKSRRIPNEDSLNATR